MLNYRHLYYFYLVATEGSLTAASKKARIGSSALSLQIAELEESLAHPLFVRRGRGLQMTEMGRETLGFARAIFELGDQLQEFARGHDSRRRLHLHLGVPDSVPKALCARLVQIARAQDVPSTLSLREGSAEDLFREILEHRVDLVLADERPSATHFPGFLSRSLGRLPVVVCGAPRFKGLRQAFPNSLNAQPFLLPAPDHSLRGAFDAYLLKYQVKVDPVIETRDLSLLKLLGAQGLGLFAAPRPAVAHLIQEKRLVEIGLCNGVTEEFFLVSAPRRTPHPLVERISRRFRI